MTDHVRTLRKRLERMERAEAQNSGRPVNRRDQALADALRAAIKVMESPRYPAKNYKLGPGIVSLIGPDGAVKHLGVSPGLPVETELRVVVTQNEAGDVVAVTRQDDEGRIVEVIWLASDGVQLPAGAGKSGSEPKPDDRVLAINRALTNNAHFVVELEYTLKSAQPGALIGMTFVMAHGVLEVLLAAMGRAPCAHDWRPVPGAGGMIDQCSKCGSERA